VVLAHLRQGSVEVAAGEDVAVGSRLGRVGNSGNSSEPHLHIHAVRGRIVDPAEVFASGTPVPMRFGRSVLHRHSSSWWSDVSGGD